MPEFPSNRIWRLAVSTFVGTLSYAEHYMGTLRPPDKRDNPNIFGGKYGWGPDPVQVEYVLDEETAKRLSTDDFTYKVGWECSRFFSHEDVVAAGIAKFMELAEPGEILLSEYDYLTDGDKPLATKET